MDVTVGEALCEKFFPPQLQDFQGIWIKRDFDLKTFCINKQTILFAC